MKETELSENLNTPLNTNNINKTTIKFSRAFLLIVSMILFVIVFFIPLASRSNTSGFFFAGGVLGIITSGFVLVAYIKSEWKRSSSNSLLFFRALCDMGIGFRFVLDSYFNQTLCNSNDCSIQRNDDPWTDDELFRKCAAPSGMVEFFELASEMWFFCLAFDLAVSITNPFSSLSQRMKWYHLFSWSVALGMALILTLVKGLHGFWYIDEDVDETAICWIKSSQNGSRVNYRTWVFLYIPLILVYMYCIRVLSGAYSHLSKGISKTFQHRVRVLVMNSLNIGIYMAYWAVLGIFYALAYGFSNSNPTLSRWFWRVVMFIISSKGFADWLVFILVSDANVLSSGGETTESLDVNGALRQEVLHYATTGIRECAARKSNTPTKRKLVLLMTQKNIPLTNILTLQHLITLVFKGENIAQNVNAVNAAQTEENMQLETIMHHVEDESERQSESTPAPGTKLKRRSTLSKKIGIPEGYDINNTNNNNSVAAANSPLTGSALSANLDVDNRELSIESHHIGREISSASTPNRVYGSWINPFGHSSSKNHTPTDSNTESKVNNQTDEENPYEGNNNHAISTSGDDRDTVDYTGTTGLSCWRWIQDVWSWPSDLMTTFSMKSSTEASVEFVEYEPYYFRQIRLSAGVEDNDYITSFMKTIKERLTEGGASGAFFFFTKDEKFIAKSCTLDEIAHIRRSSLMLSKYFQDNPESFITRIYGAYKLRIYGTSFYFFVTNNIFLNPTDEVINEKYDLKGSWVKRNSTPPQVGQRATCTHCNQKYTFMGKKRKKQKSYKMLIIPRSTNNIHSEEKKEVESDTSRCPMQVLGLHEPNVILKDNDLKHKIRLPGSTARFLLSQLEKDSELLCSFGVMDYSLLVGVHNTEYFVDDPSICAPDSPKTSSTPSEPRSLLKTSIRKIDLDTTRNSSSEIARRSSCAGPRNGRLQVSRIVGPDAYYMGIVDFQQLYNFEKKMERFFKVYVKGEPPEGLSCLEPVAYRARFLRRMEELLDLEEV